MFKNKKSLFLIGALLLVIAVYFLLKRNTGSTLTGNDRDFEFASTDKIDKIFLSNKFNRKYVLLKKTGPQKWTLNDSFVASIYQIEVLFEGLKKMRVKRPVSKKELETVKKNIALNGTKVEIYENNKLSKVYYVGGNTQDEMGTFFLMEGAKEPYVCHIPGFNGYLNARFYTQVEGWRSKNIFSLKDEQIKSIEINWTETPDASFVINNNAKEPLLSIGGQEMKNNTIINLNSVRSYLKLWENLSFEGFPIDLDAQKIDSIYKTTPFLTIRVTDKNNKVTSLRIHKKGIKRDSNVQFDDNGNALQYDIEVFYAFINGNSKEVVQIQDYIFGKVMKTNNDFLIKR